MINYIRAHKTDADTIKSLEAQPWTDDAYLKPVVIEPWLMFGTDRDLRSSAFLKTNDVNFFSSYRCR